MPNLNLNDIFPTITVLVGLLIITLMTQTSTNKALQNTYIGIGWLISLIGIMTFWLN